MSFIDSKISRVFGLSKIRSLKSRGAAKKSYRQLVVKRNRFHFKSAKQRTLVLIATTVLIFSIVIPTVDFILTDRRYQLASASEQLLDKTNPNIAAKLTYDPQARSYFFNKKGLDAAPKSSVPSPDAQAGPDPAAALKQMQAQVGGASKAAKSLYSVEFPEDASKGITYYDNNLGVSFKLFSEDSGHSPRLVDDRVVYPAKAGVKAVYTAKSNGIKEDIIVPEFQGDTLKYTYKLELPKELEARLTDGGGLGVYSADPTFFGNISYGSPEDETNVRNARLNGDKKHLVFAIPAPTIVQTGTKGQGNAQAYFTLDNNRLTVTAEQLKDLTYPISVDPSVVITSSTEFQTASSSENIDFTTAGQISRTNITGGSVASFSTTTSFTTARAEFAAVAYNGFMYVLGGLNNGTDLNDVEYAAINANGTVGTWTATTSFNAVRRGLGAVVSNGYMYVIGGYHSASNTSCSVVAGNYCTDVQYASINANGTVGSWATTTALATGKSSQGTVIVNNYIYVLGGLIASGSVNDVLYAPINANGTIGSWATTTSFTTIRANHVSLANNGYMYVIGGGNSGNLNDVQYAPINANGTLGSWTTTSSFTTARAYHAAAIYGGYLYVYGGSTGAANLNDVQFAPVNLNGSLGAWEFTNSFATLRYGLGGLITNGNIYVLGGSNGSPLSDVQYSKINGAGSTSSYTGSSTFAANVGEQGANSGRYYHRTVVYNNFIYVLGGHGLNGLGGETSLGQTQFAALSTNGSIGTWTVGSALPSQREGFGAFATGGYMYIFGGLQIGTPLSDVRQAVINTDGTLGAWSAAGVSPNLPETRYHTAATTYGGYAYVAGGIAPGYGNDVLYAAINTSNGVIGAWTRSANTMTSRNLHTSVISAGYLYVIGGIGATTSIQYAQLNMTNGSVGTWTTAAALATGRDSHTSEIYNGVLYIFGGRNGATNLNDSLFAPLNSDGSIGTFVSTSSFTTARYGHSSAVYRGYLYVLGGRTTVYVATTQYANIDNGGIGTTTGSYTATTALSVAITEHTSVAYNNYIYVIGGTTDGVSTGLVNTVRYAPINSNGSIGSWNTTATLITARAGHASVVSNGYLYVFGGISSSTVLDTVEYASINSNGTLGSWTATTSLSAGRTSGTAAVYNGYVYYIGGVLSGTAQSNTQYALICTGNNSGTGGCSAVAGSLGSWVATTALLSARYNHTTVTSNGYIYTLAGYTGTSYLTDVDYAPLNGDGTIGTWTKTTRLGGGRQSQSAVIAHGYIYLFGGLDGAGNYNDTQFAPINPNGALGAWSTTASFTNNREGHSSVYYNGYLYVTAGNNGATEYTDTQYAAINVISRSARYSKLIDIGSVVTLSDINYSGSLANSGAEISFRTAGTDGIFGASAAGSTLGGTCGTGVSGTRFVLITIDINDKDRASFADDIGFASTLQDLTVDYLLPNTSVAPNLRLHGGKFFAGQVQQPLDTIKSTVPGC